MKLEAASQEASYSERRKRNEEEKAESRKIMDGRERRYDERD